MHIISKNTIKLFFRCWAEEIGDIDWHVLDNSIVMLLQLLQEFGVRVSDEVNGNSLPSESTRSTNSMDVFFLRNWQIVVDDQIDLLNVNSSCEQVGCDEHS